MFADAPLQFVDLTLPTAAENVALDSALLQQREATGGASLLRLWELPTYAVIIGRSNRLEKNVHVERCRRDGVPVIRRASGGGTVLLGPGALVYSLVLETDTGSHLANVDAATTAILGRLLRGLSDDVAGLGRQGDSDLTIGDLKVSGNAQRWLRNTVLHHGTLLYDFDLERIAYYLTPPEREPEYRHGRSHKEFVRNLPIGRETLRRRLIEMWNATLPAPPLPWQATAELVEAQFGRPEWTERLR